LCMEKLDLQLIEFWRQHPEYFTGDANNQNIRADLKSSIEAYSKAIDPECYDELAQKVLEFKAHSLAQKQERMAELVKGKEAHRRTLNDVESEFRNYEAKILELRDEMRRYRRDQVQSEATSSKKGRGDYFFVVLDIVGIIFLYAGFILSDEIDYSLLSMGCMFFVASFYLYRGGRSHKTATASNFSEDLATRIQSRYEHVQEIWTVKKLTLQQRKKESLLQLKLIDEEIRETLQGLNVDAN